MFHQNKKYWVFLPIFLIFMSSVSAQVITGPSDIPPEVAKQLGGCYIQRDIEGGKRVLQENGLIEAARDYFKREGSLGDIRRILLSGNADQLKNFIDTSFPHQIAQIEKAVRMERSGEEGGMPGLGSADAAVDLEEDANAGSRLLGVSPFMAVKEIIFFTVLTLGFLFLPYKPIKNQFRIVLGFKHRKAWRY